MRGRYNGAMSSLEFPRNIALARVWTHEAEPIAPAILADLLTERGFVPGVADHSGTIHAEAGLAEAQFVLGDEPWRYFSLSSSKGEGCTVQLVSPETNPVPDDYVAQRAVRHPRQVYLITSGGPSNSDRNLCENLAEALLVALNGVVEIAGRGTKGNKPTIYTRPWIGEIKH